MCPLGADELGQYGIYQSREPTCRDATKRGHIALETQDLSFCNTKTDGSN